MSLTRVGLFPLYFFLCLFAFFLLLPCYFFKFLFVLFVLVGRRVFCVTKAKTSPLFYLSFISLCPLIVLSSWLSPFLSSKCCSYFNTKDHFFHLYLRLKEQSDGLVSQIVFNNSLSP